MTAPGFTFAIPNAPIHPARPQLDLPFTLEELLEKGRQFVEAFLKQVVLAVQGLFVAGETAFAQLQAWAAAVTATADGAADDLAALLDNLLGTGHTIEDLVNYLQSIPGSAISGYTAIEQQILNAIATALGHPPPPNATPDDIRAYLTPAAGISDAWIAALNALHLPTPLALIQQIPQSIPALVRDVEGGLSAVGSGLTRGVDGAIFYAGDGLTHLVQQADQGVLSLQQVTDHLVHVAAVLAGQSGGGAAAAVANPGVADLMAAGQTAHTALVGAIEQAGVVFGADVVAGAAQLGGVVQTAEANAQGLIGGVNNAAAGLLAGGSALLADAQINFQALFAGPVQFLRGLGGGTLFSQAEQNAAYAAAAAAQAAAVIEMSRQQSAFNAVFNVSPSTAGNINVTVDFTSVANQPGMSGLMLPGSGSGSGFMGVTSGEAAWKGGTGADVEVFPTQTVSNYQVVTATLGQLNDLYYDNGINTLTVTTLICARVNSARNTYVSVNVISVSGSAYLWLVATVSGTPTVLSTSAAFTPAVGGKVQLILGDPSSLSEYAMQVLYNNTPKITFTDGSHVSQLGSGQRYVGLGESSTASGKFPATIKTVTYQDNPPPPTSYPYSGLPTAGTKGRQYWSNDVGLALRDNGVAWETVWGGVLGAFTPPSPSGWSWVNQGGATISTELGGEALTAPSSTRNWRLRVRSLSPVSNYVAKFYLNAAGAATAAGANQWLSGIVLRDSVSGSFITFGPGLGSSGAVISVSRWTDATTFSANSFAAAPGLLPGAMVPNWFQVRDDGTNRYFDYLIDGVDPITVFTESRTAFITPDQIGFGFDNEGSGANGVIRLRSLAGVS